MALSTRARASEKANDNLHIWKAVGDLYHPTSNPNGFATLGVSENTLMAKELSQHIHDHFRLPKHAFTYGDGMTGSKRMKGALAKFLTRHLQPVLPLESANITITNGCSSAVEHLAWAVANPGDAFLLGRPYYNTFVPDLILRTGCRVITVDFHQIDPLSVEGVHHYELALQKAIKEGHRVAGLIISNPHNPLGRCYPPRSLLALMDLCSKYNMHFICDEVYALSVWDNKVDKGSELVPFKSCLSLSVGTALPKNRIHVIWGMSKDFGANGLRIGAVISQENPGLHDALVAVALYSSPSSASEHIAANILEDREFTDLFIQQNQDRLAERHQLVANWARSNDIPYAAGANAAFFLWADLGSLWKKHHPAAFDDNLDDLLMNLFLQNKVYVSSGKDFGSEKPGWFRIVFSQDEIQLRTGLQRVVTALRPEGVAKL